MPPRKPAGNASRRRSRGVIGTLVNDATGILQSVANDVAPGVVGAIDVNGVVQRVDFQSVADQLDIQSILDRVDLNVLLEQVDVTALLERTDLNAVLERVDMDDLIDRIDLNRVLGRLDLNALLLRVDIEALIQHTEVSSIIAATGSGVAAKVVDVARSQGVGLDLFVQRWVDRLLRRPSGRGPLAPGVPDVLTAEPRDTSSVEPGKRGDPSQSNNPSESNNGQTVLGQGARQ